MEILSNVVTKFQKKKKLSWEVEKDRTPEKKVNGARCTTEVKCTQRKKGMCCWDCKNKVNVLFTWIGGQIAPPNYKDFKRSEQENDVQTEPITVPEMQRALSR